MEVTFTKAAGRRYVMTVIRERGPRLAPIWSGLRRLDVSKDVVAQAQVELSGGIPFMSDNDLRAALDKAGVPTKTADAIITENVNARIAGLRSSLSLLALPAAGAARSGCRWPGSQAET